jgi:hypothetical protein
MEKSLMRLNISSSNKEIIKREPNSWKSLKKSEDNHPHTILNLNINQIQQRLHIKAHQVGQVTQANQVDLEIFY